MRKSLFFVFAALAAVAFTFASCSKDDDNNGNSDNKFTFNGKTYTAIGGAQFFYGDAYDSGTNNIDIYIGNESGFGLNLELFVPTDKTELISGTYTFKQGAGEYEEMTFCNGWITTNDGDTEFEITGGTVKVSKNGNNYTVEVDCQTRGAGKVTGKYVGKLEYYDDSDEW